MLNCFNIVDSGYVELTKNQILNFQKEYMHNCLLHIYCLDNDSLIQLNKFSENFKNIKIINSTQVNWRGQEAHYGDERFRNLMKLRPRMFKTITTELNGALHTEADVFWFNDPNHSLNDKEEYDWIIQHDSGGGEYDTPWLNVGCAYYGATRESFKLFDLWISHHDSSSLMDQEALCDVLSLTSDKSMAWPKHTFFSACEKLGIKLRCMDKKFVQNGYNAFKQNYINLYKADAVHVNHHTGNRIKIDLLKSCNGWLLDR